MKNYFWEDCLHSRLCPGTDVHPSVHRFQIQSGRHGSVPAKGLALALSARCAYLPACDLRTLFLEVCLLQASSELEERLLLCTGYCSDNSRMPEGEVSETGLIGLFLFSVSAIDSYYIS